MKPVSHQHHHSAFIILMLLLTILLDSQTALAELTKVLPVLGVQVWRGSLDECKQFDYNTVVEVVKSEDLTPPIHATDMNKMYLVKRDHSKFLKWGANARMSLTRQGFLRVALDKPMNKMALTFLYGSPLGIKFTVTGQSNNNVKAMDLLMNAMRGADVCIDENSPIWQSVAKRENIELENKWDTNPTGTFWVKMLDTLSINNTNNKKILTIWKLPSFDLLKGYECDEAFFWVGDEEWGPTRVVEGGSKLTTKDWTFVEAAVVRVDRNFRLFVSPALSFSRYIDIWGILYKEHVYGDPFVVETANNAESRMFVLPLLRGHRDDDHVLIDRSMVHTIIGDEWKDEYDRCLKIMASTIEDLAWLSAKVTILTGPGPERVKTTREDVLANYTPMNDLIIECARHGEMSCNVSEMPITSNDGRIK
eukprot:GHVS01027009.1.p1 GENE.GHVS01027009.1~~GHVS01027009.1.p1  ORF type:complete len:421 (+),score=40.32 GHVS01027009.1:139-1401(+)